MHEEQQSGTATSFNEARYGGYRLDGNEFLFSNDRMKTMLSVLRGLGGERILDVGCTDGFMSMVFREMGLYVIGVDASETAVAQAKTRCHEAYVANLDGHPLPLPDACVDLIWAGEIIVHLFGTESFARELCRVMRPGGHLVLSTPNLASWINRLTFPLGYQPFFTEVGIEDSNCGNPLRQISTPAGHIRLFTLSSLRHLLTTCGWTFEKAYGASLLEKPGIRGVDRLLSHACPSLASDMIVVCRKDPRP